MAQMCGRHLNAFNNENKSSLWFILNHKILEKQKTILLSTLPSTCHCQIQTTNNQGNHEEWGSGRKNKQNHNKFNSCCRSRRKKTDGGLSHRSQKKLPLLKAMVGQACRLQERMIFQLMIRTLLPEETERLFQSSLSRRATWLRWESYIYYTLV